MDFSSNLLGLEKSQKAYEQVYSGDGVQPSDHSSLTQEIIAGAAGFAAMKAYENHVRRSGQQASHRFMKDLLAGFASGEVDKLFETKGLDVFNREKAKKSAVEQAHYLAEQEYGPGGTYKP